MVELKERYGRLRVIGQPDSDWYVQVQCECGVIKKVKKYNLTCGSTQSCGCWNKERSSKANSSHGLSKHPLFPKFNAMRERCYNKNNNRFSDYGGRGITICDEWLNNPQAFFDWAIANGYKEGLEIDRKENNGNYTPENCRFVTHAINSQNTRRTKLTESNVLEIRKMYSQGVSPYSIADKYGISQGHVSNICTNRVWKSQTIVL